LSIGAQFLAEAALLAVAGGAAGAVLGGFASTVYAAARHWRAVVPVPVLLAAVALALLLGAWPGCTRRCALPGSRPPMHCGSARTA
jgi:ABC-type antimicrobial peptide transport system permease subunit